MGGQQVMMLSLLVLLSAIQLAHPHDLMGHPLSRISLLDTTLAPHIDATIQVTPPEIGLRGRTTDWVTVKYSSSSPTNGDWIAVFSPSNFSSEICPKDGTKMEPPLLCTAPIKFQHANFSNPSYNTTGAGTLHLVVSNQRSDFSFALFTGGFSSPKLLSVSNTISFLNPKAPAFPRLAQGREWNEMTVTWTSGYGIDEAIPFVEWNVEEKDLQEDDRPTRSPAGTLTFDRSSMCGPPARTVGWRDPGFHHTSFLKNLWPNLKYRYRLGHKLFNRTIIWSKWYRFKASPFPGQDSLQRVIVFGDMGKAEPDGSTQYEDYQPGSLLVTRRLIDDLENFDMIMLIGDLSYSNGYLSQWDQFTAQVEPLASAVPMMVASGNHERDYPGSGSFYGFEDSGGECGVPAETMFYVPAENRAKFWYSTDYGMFRFCVADTEHDWRPGTEQYNFIERCFRTVDRRKQPWLIFLAHRVLGYSSDYYYAKRGSFNEPMGRESLQQLWQKYKVDLAIYGHFHNYERSCPIYENVCTDSGMNEYKGMLNGTIHLTVGGGGAKLKTFTDLQTDFSLFKDNNFGYSKLTAVNHSYLLFEYIRASDGKVHDYFTIYKEYRDIVACTKDSCEPTTLAQ